MPSDISKNDLNNTITANMKLKSAKTNGIDLKTDKNSYETVTKNISISNKKEKLKSEISKEKLNVMNHIQKPCTVRYPCAFLQTLV